MLAADADWGLASVLARTYLERDTYKCFELPSTSTGNIGRNKLVRFREALKEKEIYFVEDKLSHRNYKQHAVTDESFLKNILIKIDGEHESLGSVSALLKTPVVRVVRVSCTRFRRHRFRCFMEQEVCDGETSVYARVQA